MGWIRKNMEINRLIKICDQTRKLLGLERFEYFTFEGKKNKKEKYYFGYTKIFKVYENGNIRDSHVSFNYLLSAKDEIRKVGGYHECN